MNKIGFLILFAAIFLAGCADPAANKPKAETSEPSSTKTEGNTEKAELKGTGLAITSDTSKVEFTGSKVTGKHEGGFKKVSGMIDLVNEKPEESSVSVEIDMASVYSDADGLTKHLKTGDFFEVEKYPKSKFVSTKIAADGEKGENAFNVTGDLEMRGQKKSITFPATIKVGDEKVEVDAEFSINRKDFGIVYAGKADDLIRDNVVIKLDLESARKK
ncbi:MAG: YceI family protein [Pyrinomonadaceae bacterium]|nr:YceI family protein [Pyrinomonadaceae bacterium]